MRKYTSKEQLRSKLRWGIAGIVALFLIVFSYIMPGVVNAGIDGLNNAVKLGLPRIPEKPFHLGLDLQGGASLIYEADTNAIAEEERGAAVEGVRDIIERRVNGLGVGEPNVQTAKVEDTYRVLVELPGVTDVNTAITMIGETPILEFKEENDVPPRELTKEEQDRLNAFNTEAEKRAQAILNDVKNGGNFEEIAKEKSEDTVSKNNGGYLGFIPNGTIYQEMYDWAKTAKEGDVSQQLIKNFEGYNIVKRGAEQEGEPEATASHILFCYLGARGCDNPTYTKQQAREKAQEIFNQANATNFADLAKEFSTEPGAAETGGDLGSFTKSTMVPAFAEAVFNAQAGEIIGPVETEFGYHVIYKRSQQTTKNYELWRILVKTQSETDILPPYDMWKNTDLSGKQLERAEVVTDPTTGAVQVSLQFDPEGRELFAQLTERNVQKPIAIFLDGEPISVPTVQQPILDGRAVITGTFNVQEARLLSQRLNTGALPVPIELVSQQSIGATLGAESLAKSLRAGIGAFILVIIFMILYYRVPGLIASFALCLYLALTLALLKLIGVTMTLAGIAGFILSIGMAVDTNVLIFERLKEELHRGKTMRAAIEEGFLRAWNSIRDGSLSTLLTGLFLLLFGSSFVKGFAVTLMVGLLVGLFTAVTVTRVLLRFVSPWFKERGQWYFLAPRNRS